MSLLSLGLDSMAKKKANKKQAKLIDKNTALMGQEFDKRDLIARQSDDRISNLVNREYGDQSKLADSTFSYLLGQNQTGFDEQQTIAKKAFDEQMGAFGGLMTAKRASRLEQIDASERERARQQAFQSQADDLAAALPGQIGFDSQQEGRANAFADRSAFINKNTTAPAEAPSFARDPRLAGAYAGANQAGVQSGVGDALHSATLSSYRDAYQGSERDLADFASAIDTLTNKAEISRSALPAELAVGGAKAKNAQDTYDATIDFSKGNAERTADTAKNYRDALTASKQQNSDALAQAFDNYFGRQYSTENNLVGNLLDASLNKQNQIVGIRNQQIQGIRPNTFWGDLARTAEKAANAYAKGGG
jgi:hypothetical protein